jgi:hypothetical protein
MRHIVIPALFCGALSACATANAPAQKIAELPPAPMPGEPSDIAGLTPAQLRAMFGEPSFVRKDTGMQMWRYDGASCKAFFFLYPNASAPNSGTLGVRHVETIPAGWSMAADTACLSALRVRRAAS